MVSAKRRSSIAALKLLRQHFGGSQLISVTDASNESAALIWTTLGAEVIPIYSFTWSRLLRSMPTKRMLTQIGRLTGLNRVSKMMTPLADRTDSFISEVYPGRQPFRSVELDVRNVTTREFAALAEECSDHLTTFDYEAGSLTWLFAQAKPNIDAKEGLRVKAV